MRLTIPLVLLLAAAWASGVEVWPAAAESGPGWVRVLGGKGDDGGAFGLHSSALGVTVVGESAGFVTARGQVVPAGTLIARFDPAGELSGITPLRGLEGGLGQAAFGPDGAVYIAATVAASRGRTATVVAVEADGTERWRTALAPSQGDPHADFIEGIAIGGEGSLYVVWGASARDSGEARRAQGGFLTRLGTDGRVDWRRPLDGTANPTVAVDRAGRAYVGADGQLIAFSRSGAVRWRRSFRSRAGFFFGAAVSADGRICLAGASAAGGRGINLDFAVTCVGPSGRLLWSNAVGGAGADVGLGLAFDHDGTLVVVGASNSTRFLGLEGAGDFDAVVLRFSRGGVLRHRRMTGGTGEDAFGLVSIAADGAVYLLGASSSPEFRGYPVAGGHDLIVERVR